MQKFGSTYTVEKLDAVEEYLKRYSVALRAKGFRLVYFDAFAGTGQVDVSGAAKPEAGAEFDLWKERQSNFEFDGVEEMSDIVAGSATRALRLARPFDHYIFVERDRAKAKQLSELRAQYPNLSVDVVHDDANSQIEEFCRRTDWKRTRALVFLDPFGSQVNWSTVQAIAATRAIDLWYLFPAFWSVYRQISGEGKVTPEQESSITRILGTDEWKKLWMKRELTSDFFNSAAYVGEKQVDVEQVTRYMISRLQTVFKGGVLDDWLALGPKRRHDYSLLFAWANPHPKAQELARKFAIQVMSKSKNG